MQGWKGTNEIKWSAQNQKGVCTWKPGLETEIKDVKNQTLTSEADGTAVQVALQQL